MGRNIFLRGQRTGIIVALLSISMGRGGEGGRGGQGTGAKGAKNRENDRAVEEEGGEEEEGEGEGRRRGRFRSRHPVYRSFIRDVAPMAWRSRQIIITNHQLFARNG